MNPRQKNKATLDRYYGLCLSKWRRLWKKLSSKTAGCACENKFFFCVACSSNCMITKPLKKLKIDL